MRIEVVDRSSIKDYLAFCKKVYTNNVYYRDSMSTILKSILTGKAQICKSSMVLPVMVLDSEKVVAVCIFALVDRLNDTLQITFFEALENQEQAVKMIVDYGKKLARRHGAGKILLGLNFHVNYGLGFLADQYQCVPSFGTAYNPPYYIDYFKPHADEQFNLVSYLAKVDNFDVRVDKRLMDRVAAKYKVRKMNFSKFTKEVETYTNLNNEAFKHHKFYYQRRLEEDLELFKQFKVLLKEENMLFLEENGKAIGFMLWYPDFNELIGAGETVGLKTVLKNRLLPNKIRKFKIVELGVLPEYHKKGAVLALFHKCRELVQGRYDYCESGWILEDNLASRGLGMRWADQEYKHYQVFTIDT